MAQIKKACAICNHAVGELDGCIKDAICTACDDILEGKLHDQFICDPIQGGAGTTANMNANDVIPTAAKMTTAKTAIKTGESVRQVLKNKNIFSDEEIDKLLDPATMV